MTESIEVVSTLNNGNASSSLLHLAFFSLLRLTVLMLSDASRAQIVARNQIRIIICGHIYTSVVHTLAILTSPSLNFNYNG